ncbi:MAG TPA: T9SS type A sorting domain-containing protein [Bacteroidia bacterium]|nr:T9SS type A sorting domain-containing protein [Bacteroidia bacterium]HNS13169.1 T9SS type A sorting domain-containing protein [Bacteroidia bacterium]
MFKLLRIALLLVLPAIAFSQPVNLEVRAYSQGFYSPLASEMVPVIDPVNSPNICDTATIVLIDSISGQGIYCDRVPFSVRGYGYSIIPSVYFGGNYQIGVKFRNTIHIVSMNTLLLDSVNKSIDLTLAANLCCSFDTTYGVAAAYSGDVNNDGTIDGTDLGIIDNDITMGLTGYVISDLTGDAIVNSLDLNLANDNSLLSLFDLYSGSCLPTNISDLGKFSFALEAYPNPFSTHFNLILPESFSNIEVQVSDAMGKVFTKKNFKNTVELQIETGELHSGLYFVQVIADNKKANIKLLAY